jgi:UDP-glucose 4-epimerase
MARRILITGGAGFIGSHLVERLALEGDEVHVLDDLSRGRPEWLPAGTSLHQTDLREPDSVRKTVRSVSADVVVHLAALHFIPEVDGAPELARQVNVEGTQNLLQALSESPPKILLFTSSAAVYADRSGPISEECPVAPVDLYGRTKAMGEQLLIRFGAETGAQCVIARLFNVIGDRETNPHVVPELVEQLRQGNTRLRLGNLHTTRDYTDVVDVAEALERLLRGRSDDSAIFNVGSGRGFSVTELVSLCKRILGRELTVTVDPARVRRHDRAELVADVGLLHTLTGWAPKRSLEETFANLLLSDERISQPTVVTRRKDEP